MKAYIIRRLVQSVAVCLAISMISFFLLFLNSDPALLLLPPEAGLEDIDIFKKSMGLDRPVIVQYLVFLKKIVLHGDFGNSFVSKTPALALMLERVPATLSPFFDGGGACQCTGHSHGYYLCRETLHPV